MVQKKRGEKICTSTIFACLFLLLLSLVLPMQIFEHRKAFTQILPCFRVFRATVDERKSEQCIYNTRLDWILDRQFDQPNHSRTYTKCIATACMPNLANGIYTHTYIAYRVHKCRQRWTKKEGKKWIWCSHTLYICLHNIFTWLAVCWFYNEFDVSHVAIRHTVFFHAVAAAFFDSQIKSIENIEKMQTSSFATAQKKIGGINQLMWKLLPRLFYLCRFLLWQ